MRLIRTTRFTLLILLSALLLPAAAVAKGPGKTDPEKAVKAVTKALSQHKWGEAKAGCAEGLALVDKSSEWYAQYGDELGIDMRVLWEQTLRGAIDEMVEYGDRKRDRDVMRHALDLTTLYLERWPDHNNSYEVSFTRAEMAYEVKEYRVSADAYRTVFEMNSNTGARRHEAAAGWICSVWFDSGDSWEFFDSQAEMVKEERTDLTDLIARKQPIDLSEPELELVEAIDAYVTAVPDDLRAPGMLYRAIYLFHDRFQAQEGVTRCIAFLQGYPDHEWAPHVSRMLVDLAQWSERKDQFEMRIAAMGLKWDAIEASASRAAGDLPTPPEPDRVDLFPAKVK
jgi:hypothetical protein